MIHRSFAIVAAALAAVVGGAAPAQIVVDPTLTVETFAAGLVQPTQMTFVGPKEILVLQKGTGQVRLVLDGVLQPLPVLDLAVSNNSERGLLGIVRDPEFIWNRRVVLYYTESTVDSGIPVANRIVEYLWDGTALTAPKILLDLPVTPGPNHNGGVLAFGPDDKLYAVIGDLNRNGQLQNFPLGPVADDTGAIFRLNADGSTPADNPFFDVANPAAPLGRVFAYGVRNSFGLAFDPVAGGLWDSENGPFNFDEINRVAPAFNSGWEQIMGPDARDPQGPQDLWFAPGASYSDPEFSWSATVAPTALTFAAGPRLGCAFENDLIVGDNNCGQLYRFELSPDRQSLVFASPELLDLVADNGLSRCVAEQGEIVFGSGFGVITDTEMGPDGKFYVLSYSLGAIFRVGRTAGATGDADGDQAPDACDCAPADPSVAVRAIEVPRLRLTGREPRLSWDAQDAAAYAVISGSLAELAADAGFARACALVTASATPAAVDARPDSAPGDGHYYLVRAANACDGGTFGDARATPDPRDALDAAVPVPCP